MINLGVRCTLGLINYPFLVSTHEKVLRRVITKQVVSVPVVIFCCSTWFRSTIYIYCVIGLSQWRLFVSLNFWMLSYFYCCWSINLLHLHSC